MRIAVDIGFGFIKAMSDQKNIVNRVTFPSVITKKPEYSFQGIIGGSGDDYSIIYWEENSQGEKINTKKCFVGEAALTNGGTRRWEDKGVFNVDDMKIFIATAVGLLNPNNEPVDLVVGLPMSYYMLKKDELKELLEGVNSNITFMGIQGIRKIEIRNVMVFPQGAGAYYSAILDVNGNIKDFNLATSRVGVIDIGYRTVDYLVMSKGRKSVTIIDNLSGSLEEDGMNVAFQAIEKSLADKIGKSVGIEEIEKALLWFGGKFDFRGESISLIEYEEQAYRELGEEIASKIKLIWGTEGDLLDVVLIAGGGGISLYPVMKDKFTTARLQENSQYSNCEGYLGVQAKRMEKKVG